MRQKIVDFFDDERVACCTVPFFKCMGYTVLIFEAIIWTIAYELLLFEIIPDLFRRNFLIDLVSTTIGCGLLMGTVRSLYGAHKVKNYVTAQDFNSEQKEEPAKGPKDPETSKNKRFCKVCKINKGDTYSHCSICNRCVYEMDHHCFFLANCVGGKNYKFFLSYVLYAVLNCTIHFIFYIPYLADIFQLNFRAFHKVGIIKLVICFLMCIMGGLFTGFLLSSHIFYVTNGTSYIKDKFSKQKNQFDWKRFLLCYLRCGHGDDEIFRAYKRGYLQVFGSRSPLKALWPDF